MRGFFVRKIPTLEPDVGLTFFKKGKCSELNFRKFWPGSRHLKPFPDRPDRFQTVQTSCFLVRSDTFAQNTNSGTRPRIEIFQKSKMIRIENPKLLAWFQTPQTVSRPSRPDFQPRKTNSGSKRPIEIFKKRKMIRIEFPEFLAWFQTPQTVSRPSRPCPDRPDL